MNSNPRVGAVVFATSHTALGIVRALGRRGVPVWVLGSRTSLAAVSRYSQRAVTLPADESERIDALIRLAQDHGLDGWVLFPDSDRTVSLIARHHEALSEHYSLTVPPWDTARWALEKPRTYEIAEELGIEYPKTLYPQTIADVEAVDASFPLVLKPTRHEGTDRFSVINGAWRADDREQLLALYRSASEAVSGEPVIAVQEMVPGLGEAQVSFAALCDEGRVSASLFAQRARLLPVEFGSTSYAVTIEPILEVVEEAQRWIERVGYTGLAELEFKYHSGTDSYKLLDVNIRAWGWHPLCGFAGVDFPYLMWRLAQGCDVTSEPAEVGVRWTRTAYDLMSAIQLNRRGALTWKAYRQSLRGAHHEMYELDDLVPAFFEVPLLLRLVWNKFRGR